MGLQNGDGGIPTFCKGWGHLPFDRSGSDLTAHAISAWHVWENDMSREIQEAIDLATAKALSYLRKEQNAEGFWRPLWFGDQDREDESNPIYGTARVLIALHNLDEEKHEIAEAKNRAKEWLVNQKDDEASWGNLEQTSLAITALRPFSDFDATESLKWIENHLNDAPSPIGFYFAKLWYFEKLYPKIFALQALRSQAPA